MAPRWPWLDTERHGFTGIAFFIDAMTPRPASSPPCSREKSDGEENESGVKLR